MPEVFLTGRDEHTAEAVALLSSTLVARQNDGAPRSIFCTSTESYEVDSRALDGRYMTIESVFANTGHGTIMIRPFNALDIMLRIAPFRHEPDGSLHQTHIEHLGDYVTIVLPYYFYQDRHEVSYRKWLFFLNTPERRP